MGSTNKTAHYELPQFVANDKPSWLGDVNQAMEAIDTGIYGAKSSADGAQTTANNAVAGVQTANTRMDGMQTQLDTVATQANQTATAVNQHTASIATNSANINTINSRLGNTDISDIGDGTVTGAIESIAGGGGSASNVRWNATTDRFEVLKNGNWVQSIRAFVNTLAVFVNGIFGLSVKNGTVNPLASNTVPLKQFVVSGTGATLDTTNNTINTLVTEQVDLTNYTYLKVKSNGSTYSANVSGLSGSYYIGLYAYVETASANCKIQFGASTTETNFGDNYAVTQQTTAMPANTITLDEITLE